MEGKIKILFVCLGNICRSTAAQAVLQHLVDDAGQSYRYEIDSAGTYGGHSGQLADYRMRRAASRRGIEVTHRARQVCRHDFLHFDIIFAMDDQNMRDLQRLAPDAQSREKICCIVDYMPQGGKRVTSVPDPYYGDESDFEYVLDLLEILCDEIMHRLD